METNVVMQHHVPFSLEQLVVMESVVRTVRFVRIEEL